MTSSDGIVSIGHVLLASAKLSGLNSTGPHRTISILLIDRCSGTHSASELIHTGTNTWSVSKPRKKCRSDHSHEAGCWHRLSQDSEVPVVQRYGFLRTGFAFQQEPTIGHCLCRPAWMVISPMDLRRVDHWTRVKRKFLWLGRTFCN